MNLVQFQKKVESAISSLSKEELQSFLNEYARKLPEEEREGFLGALEAVRNNKASEKNRTLSDQSENILQELDYINERKLAITETLNEDYDDWYNPDEDEYEYDDPDHVLDIISDAIAFMQECIDSGSCSSALRVCAKLLTIQVTKKDDEGRELQEISLEDICNTFNMTPYEELIEEMILIAYNASDFSKKAEAVYNICLASHCYHISFSNVMQKGKGELPGVRQFLPEWLRFLAKTDSQTATQLLKEAVQLTDDVEHHVIFS